MSDEQKQIWNFGTVTDANETHRVTLNYFGSRKEGYDFHSLVLEKKNNNIWTPKKEITQEAFQANHNKRRWVSKLYSFDPINGHAIIQVAEGDTPIGSSSTSFYYSWRKWDLLQNRELETLQECNDPFEPYEPKSS